MVADRNGVGPFVAFAGQRRQFLKIAAEGASPRIIFTIVASQIAPAAWSPHLSRAWDKENTKKRAFEVSKRHS